MKTRKWLNRAVIALLILGSGWMAANSDAVVQTVAQTLVGLRKDITTIQSFTSKTSVRTGGVYAHGITVTALGSAAPFTINSTKVNTNLNTDLLDGQHWTDIQTAYNLAITGTAFHVRSVLTTEYTTADTTYSTSLTGAIFHEGTIRNLADLVLAASDVTYAASATGAVFHEMTLRTAADAANLVTAEAYADAATVAAWWHSDFTPKFGSVTIGANTLDTTEWAYLDGLDQALKTTSNVQHTKLTLQGANSIAVLSSELITTADDKTFDSDTGNWTGGASWVIGGGVATHTASATNFVYNLAVFAPTSNTIYQIKATVVTTTSGTLTVKIGQSTGMVVGAATGTLTQHTWVIPGGAAVGDYALQFVPSATWAGTIDNITVKSVTPSDALAQVNASAGYNTIEIRSGGPASYNHTLIGKDAGKCNLHTTSTDGYYLTAFGNTALAYCTTCSGSSAFGADALSQDSTGKNNSAFGKGAGSYITSGQDNSAFGNSSMTFSTTGSYNSAFGDYAISGMIEGSYNSSVGYQSGMYIAKGSTNAKIPNNSVFIGALAKAQADGGTNETVIGYNAVGKGSNSVMLGSNAVTWTVLNGQINAPSLYLNDVPGSNAVDRWINYANDATATVRTYAESLTGEVKPARFVKAVDDRGKIWKLSVYHNGAITATIVP